MKLTKLGHACVRLEKDGRSLAIDPGTFSDVDAAVKGAAAVLVTHEHADHIDADGVLPLLAADGSMVLYAPASVADRLRAHPAAGDAAVRIKTVEPEAAFEAAGFAISTFGGQHALIHPHIPVVANIGYLVDGRLYHPGDSFIVPHGAVVETLLVPAHAPWSKTGEVIDFVVSVRARVAIPIHDGLLNDAGLRLVDGHASRIGGHYGTEYVRLGNGESREV
jgi:L-ascorbate metabolism protein UlaG (beta-lactamase superfamily)